MWRVPGSDDGDQRLILVWREFPSIWPGKPRGLWGFRREERMHLGEDELDILQRLGGLERHLQFSVRI